MKLALFIAAALVSGSMAFAADAENKIETTVDTSKNPITGTVTEKKKHKKKVKTADGKGGDGAGHQRESCGSNQKKIRDC